MEQILRNYIKIKAIKKIIMFLYRKLTSKKDYDSIVKLVDAAGADDNKSIMIKQKKK